MKIYNKKYLKDINGSNFDLSNIIDSNRKNIIINWCGNKEMHMKKIKN